ncbi:McrC family protein [Candidatus Nitrosotenuis aquarius]|uniref:McrC family protein n=1 Tax=Candidatus Nitrosotenuis aquarius TaxID=1846278 RepID=UPI000C1F4E66|nr:hypothetical protein [Candidatus Nitrosotenuis aquarius]
MQKSITINEWESSDLVNLTKQEIDFLNDKVNEGKSNSKIEILTKGNDQYYLKATSWIGTIKLPTSHSITIKPKVGNLNFFKMLTYCENYDGIQFFDPVYASEGKDLVYFMGKLFVDTIRPIIEEGIYKNYVPIIDEIPAVKGRLLLSENIRHPRLTHEKFWCEHDELTENIMENQVLLYCTHLLSIFIRNDDVGNELNHIQQFFENHGVSLTFLESYHLDSISLQKHNEHYEKALLLCEFILKIIWYNDFTREENLPIYGFLYNMNTLYQKFVTKIVQEILIGYDVYAELKNDDMLIHIQQPNYTTNQIQRVILKPDIVIKNKQSKDSILILDTKYKEKVSTSDIYQSLAYSITFECPTILLIPEFGSKILDGFMLNPKFKKDAQIFVRSIDFSDVVNFIEKTKFEIKTTISPFLKSVKELSNFV